MSVTIIDILSMFSSFLRRDQGSSGHDRFGTFTVRFGVTVTFDLPIYLDVRAPAPFYVPSPMNVNEPRGMCWIWDERRTIEAALFPTQSVSVRS